MYFISLTPQIHSREPYKMVKCIREDKMVAVTEWRL